MSRNKQTPEILPWIPPGQPKEDTFNKFAHKKGSIASRINEEVASKKKSILHSDHKDSTHKKSSNSTNILSLSDSGRGTLLNSQERRNFKDKVVEIYEEHENKYDDAAFDNKRYGYTDSTTDSGLGSLDQSRRKKIDKNTNRRGSFDDSDDESLIESIPEDKPMKKHDSKTDFKSKNWETEKHKRLQDKDVQAQLGLDVRALTPNTAEMRGYQAMRKEFIRDDQDGINSRHSIRYYNGEPVKNTRYLNPEQSYYRNYEGDLNQSFTSFNISPRYKNSDPRQGDVPEAWLVFPDGRVPKNGSYIGDYPSPRARLSVNDSTSPRSNFISPREGQLIPGPHRKQGTLYQNPGDKGLARAIPVNLAGSIGSMLKTSFANLNNVRDTPVEEFRVGDEDKLIKEDKTKSWPTWVWVALICLAAVIFVGLVLGSIFGIISSSSGSQRLTNGLLPPGPGDNTPCKDYVALTERWRRIIGKGPSQTGEAYACDKNFKEGWYRFDGEAGSMLADNTQPPSWEDCGTSRVGWLSGIHPEVGDGTVNRTLCVTAFNGNCEVKMPEGKVRGCPDPRGGIYYVYYLALPRISCNWGYCARGDS